MRIYIYIYLNAFSAALQSHDFLYVAHRGHAHSNGFIPFILALEIELENKKHLFLFDALLSPSQRIFEINNISSLMENIF